jgi:hypothetical protein
MVGIWLQELGVDERVATTASAGWGGDTLTLASGPDGAWSLAWRIAWDFPQHATEFEDAYARISADLGFGTGYVRVSESETLVVHASTAELAGETAAVAGG